MLAGVFHGRFMRNELMLVSLEQELQRNCGDALAAAQACGVSLVFVNQWAKDDPKVAERLKEAANVGTQGLVSAAIKRAVHGVNEDIYYKGEVVGEKKVYSDGLLQTLLKAKVPEFAKDGESTGSVTVNIANIVPRAENYEQWLLMKQQTLAPPAPAITHEAEYVEIDSALSGLGL
jgi:DNA-binding transcriptional regulator YdaS (Cro superfamily)